MKSLLSFLIVLLLIVAICIGSILYLVQPGYIETFEAVESFSIEEKLKTFELDLYDTNEFTLTEHELNQLLLPYIYKELENQDLNNFRVNKVYIECSNSGFNIKSIINLWRFNIGISAEGFVMPENGKLKIVVSNFNLGKIKINNKIIQKFFDINSEDFSIVFDDEIFNIININAALVNEEGLKVYFSTNNEKAIELLVNPKDVKFAKEALIVLEEDEASKEFGNKLVNILIKKEAGFKVSQEDLFELMDTFSKIDNYQKLEIILALSKLNIDIEEILDILRKSRENI